MVSFAKISEKSFARACSVTFFTKSILLFFNSLARYVAFFCPNEFCKGQKEKGGAPAGRLPDRFGREIYSQPGFWTMFGFFSMTEVGNGKNSCFPAWKPTLHLASMASWVSTV